MTTRFSVRTLLLAYVLVPLVLTLVGMGWLVSVRFEAQSREQLKEDVQLVARAVQLPLGRALSKGRLGAVEETLRSLAQIERIYSIDVYDRQGRRITSSGTQEDVDDRGRLRLLMEAQRRAESYDEVAGQPVYSYFVPITSAGTGQLVHGLLQVTRPKRDLDAAVSAIRMEILGAGVLAILLVGAIVILGHRRAIGAPIRELDRHMGRIEAGTRGLRAPEGGPEEVRRLAGSMNRMLAGIEAAEADVAIRREREMELERELRRREKLAALGQLAGGVAHEVGTPLGVIDGQAQRLRRHARHPERVESIADAIRTEVARLGEIVKQLLEFGRDAEDRRRQVSVDRVAASVRSVLREPAREHSVEIRLEPPAEEIEIRVDPLRLEQALVNLLRNAVQATPAGGRAELAWWSVGEDLRVEIRDEGSGIPEPIRDKLFEPFFTTKPVGEGTGLGLAVVHGVVEEYGGQIEFHDREPAGTVVRLELPVVASRRAETRGGFS